MAENFQGRRVILPPGSTPREPDEIQRLKNFIKEYGQAMIIAVGLIIAVILGGIAFKNYRETSALRASQLLMNARSADDLQQVLTQYPNAPITPLALLALAARRFDEGQFEMARSTFAQLKEKYPTHPLALVADLGRAQCLEAERQLEQALQAFAAFATEHPDHFLSPMARLGKARCLHQLGRYDEARAEYEDFIAANPDSDWATIAESAILFVEKDKRAALEAPAPRPAAKSPAVVEEAEQSVPAESEPAAERPDEVSSPTEEPEAPTPEESQEPPREETWPER